jgi:3-oxoacyl-[acyl-carrier protein] reductase
MTYDLDGETAIVTGAAQGIGRGIAERLGAAGANEVLADVQGERVAETADDLRAEGVAAEAVACDVTDLDDTDRLTERARERFGTVEMLVNNAGIGTGGSFTELEPEEWNHVLSVNLTGAFNCSYSVVPGMVEHGNGRVVNVSSMAGRNVSYHGAANYTASKWGVIGLTKHMARDLAPEVRVNALCPGATLTPLIRNATTEEGRERTTQGIPLERWSTPEDQAEGAFYLLSPASSYVTGTVLEVDGGSQLTP